MSDESNYGDKFETIIIIAMCTLIVASFIGVIAIQPHDDCNTADYTYCDAAPEH